MKFGRGVSELWRVENLIDLARGLYNSLYYRTSRDTIQHKLSVERKGYAQNE